MCTQHAALQANDADPADALDRELSRSQLASWNLTRLAQYESTVLLTGESGTGKEVTARQIHRLSRRRHKPFMAVDCAAMPDELLESELFGHVKGAFTGADRASEGFFRAADGGTLLLDEVGELSARGQAKLLRTLQERVVVPVGSHEVVPVDVRLIAATHRDLWAMVREKAFREDLYYRLDVVHLHLPPLRETPGAIVSLVGTLLRDIAMLHGEPVKCLSDEAWARVRAYAWPGNVRELANALEHGCVLAEAGTIEAAHLPPRVRAAGSVADGTAGPKVTRLADAERVLIREALKSSGGDKGEAARWLGISRSQLYRRLRRHGTDIG